MWRRKLVQVAILQRHGTCFVHDKKRSNSSSSVKWQKGTELLLPVPIFIGPGLLLTPFGFHSNFPCTHRPFYFSFYAPNIEHSCIERGRLGGRLSSTPLLATSDAVYLLYLTSIAFSFPVNAATTALYLAFIPLVSSAFDTWTCSL